MIVGSARKRPEMTALRAEAVIMTRARRAKWIQGRAGPGDLSAS